VIQITRLIGNIPNTPGLFKTTVPLRCQYFARFLPKKIGKLQTHEKVERQKEEL